MDRGDGKDGGNQMGPSFADPSVTQLELLSWFAPKEKFCSRLAKEIPTQTFSADLLHNAFITSACVRR